MGIADINWGDVPTWCTFAATAVAVAAAIYAGLKASDLLRVERDRDEDRRLADERAQASRVAAWAAPTSSAAFNSGIRAGFNSPGVEAVVLNKSDQVIYQVSIAWWFGQEVIGTAGADLIPPSDVRTWPLLDDEFDSVYGADASGTYYQVEAEAVAVSRSVAERLRIEVSYTDATNRRWNRSPEGLLTMVTV